MTPSYKRNQTFSDKQPDKGKIKSGNQKGNKLKDVQNALKKLDVVIGKEKQRDISIYEETQNTEPDLNSKISGDNVASHASVEIVKDKAEMDASHPLGINSSTTHSEDDNAKTDESETADQNGLGNNSASCITVISAETETETVERKILSDENSNVPTEASDDLKNILLPEKTESEEVHVENPTSLSAAAEKGEKVEKIEEVEVEVKIEAKAVRVASARFLSLSDSEQKKEFCLNCREIEECSVENIHLQPR